MQKKLTIFFLFLLTITIPSSFATSTVTATVVSSGETIIYPDEFTLDPGETLDLEQNVKTVDKFTETVGGQALNFTQQVQVSSAFGEPIELTNTALTSVEVSIPDDTTISAPIVWDGQLSPPTNISTSGITPSGFQTPTTSISIGSANIVLIFDKAVTIILEGTTGQTAYKLSGEDDWILISTCTGTFTNPDNPPANSECSISNGVDTKILTFHFTEFTGLTVTPTVETPSTSSSGGHGNTGVGSPRIFGSSGGSSGGGTYYGPGDSAPRIFPAWFDNVTDWYRQGHISALEFLNAYQWIIENVMK